MDALLQQLQKHADWQNQYIGRQMMQTAVLRWAVANKDALAANLTESLVAAMNAEIAIHHAAKPIKEAA